MLKAVAVLDGTSTGKANVAAAPKKSGAGGPVTFSQDSQDCQARNGNLITDLLVGSRTYCS